MPQSRRLLEAQGYFSRTADVAEFFPFAGTAIDVPSLATKVVGSLPSTFLIIPFLPLQFRLRLLTSLSVR